MNLNIRIFANSYIILSFQSFLFPGIPFNKMNRDLVE